MTTTIEYALMAGHAYRTTRDEINWLPVPQGWTPFFPVPDPTTPTFPATDGFEAVSFIKGTEIVISFAGTDFSSPLSDFLQANIPLASGFSSSQLEQAADYYLQVRALNPDAHITFTGHSLGGGLAALMAVMFDESAFTFDQAPFRASATEHLDTDADGNTITRSAAEALRSYLAGKVSDNTMLLKLDAYIAANRIFNPSGIAADTLVVRETKVIGINTQNEVLSYLPLLSRIGGQADITNSNAGVSATDLHSQALLTAFLQSQQSADPYKSLSDVTFKLPELLKMIFDKNLFASDPLNKDTPVVNFLEHIVKHEAGIHDPLTGAATLAADQMVTRFTTDLWKLAQDGGLTLTDGNPGFFSGATNNVSKALIAFAMQKYYEQQSGGGTLFSDVNGGIQFDLAAVSNEFAAALVGHDPEVLKLALNNIKGYKQYFLDYLKQGSLYTQAERAIIQSMLPALQDWYVQAGTTGLMTTDLNNRGAFMLGGTGSDVLVGGTKADLLVGNLGNDTLMGGLGNDMLLGGTGNDTYVYTAGDGLDTILDRDGQGSIVVDGNTLAGGDIYGDNRVHRDADKHLYVDVGSGRLVIDGNLMVQNYQAGNLGISLSANPVAEPVADTAIIYGDLAPQDQDLGTAGVQTATDSRGNIITDPNTPEAGRTDLLHGSGVNDIIVGLGGSDIVDGKEGDDRLYANTQISVATAISQGNNQSGSGQRGDWLNGGAGNDILVGGNGNDVLAGGTGSDLLIGGAGQDVLLGDNDAMATDSFDWSIGYGNAANGGGVTLNSITYNTAPPDSGTDPLRAQADVIYAGEGNDYAAGGRGNDIIFGEDGVDILEGNSGNDVILGGTGKDILFGDNTENSAVPVTSGEDYLDGGDGDDTIHGNGGDDILIGGKHNDTLYGGTGQDTYIYNAGDGIDTIDDTKADNNILRFGAGVNSNNITLNLGSLLLNLGNGDAIHIEGFDSQDALNSSSISSFEFDDGSVLSVSELLARGFDLDGTAGDDALFGRSKCDASNDVRYECERRAA